MKRNISFFIALLCIVPFQFLFGAEKESITLEEYVSYVEENAPDLLSSKLDADISKTDVQSAKGAGDVTLTGSTALYQTKSGNRNGWTTTKGTKAEAGLEKTFLSTGTNVYSTLSYDHYDSGTISGYAPTLTVGASQPLLYNFLGAVNKYDLKSAEMQYEIDKIQYDLDKASLLNDYKKLYIEWITYKMITENNELNIKNAQANYKQVLRKKERRLAENDDVQEAYASLLTYQQTYNENLITLNNLENQINTAVNLENAVPKKSEFDGEYQDARSFKFSYIPFESTKNYETSRRSLEILKLANDVADNMLLPELNVYGEVSETGDSETAGDSFGEMNQAGYEVGLEMSYALGNNENKANSEKAKLQYRQMEYELRSAANTYENNIKYLIDSAERYDRIITYLSRKITSLKSKLATEEKKYNQARVTLSTVLDTRNSIATAEVNLISAKMSLVEIYYDYVALTVQ